MSFNYNGKERRKYQRFEPTLENYPRIHLIVEQGKRFSVDVVNISAGGLLCYTAAEEGGLSLGQRVETIEISFPDRRPISCSGVIIRLQPAQKENLFFCAIEFTELDSLESSAITEISKTLITRKEQPEEATAIPDWKFLERIQQAPNYMILKDVDKENEVRCQVYDSFDDITANLSIEERWWFYEILDEMKRREPECPEGLKEAFLRFCRAGSSSVAHLSDL